MRYSLRASPGPAHVATRRYSRGFPGLPGIAPYVLALVNAAVFVLLGAGCGDPHPSVQNRDTAVTTLRGLAGAQGTFRRADRYGAGFKTCANGARDLFEIGDTNEPHLIDRSLADAFGTTAAQMVSPSKTGKVPKAGYVFVDLSRKPDGSPVTLGAPTEALSTYCYCAYPAVYGVTGIPTFVIDQTGTVYEKDTGGKPVTAFPRDLSTWIASQ